MHMKIQLVLFMFPDREVPTVERGIKYFLYLFFVVALICMHGVRALRGEIIADWIELSD